MTSKVNKEAIDMNIESCLKMLSTMKQFNEATMKLRLEVAEMQLKMLSLYNAPSLQLLQLLVNIPGSCQMNDSNPHIDEAMEVNTNNYSK